MQYHYVRTCQECGHRQSMIPPENQKTDNWRNAKCRKCKSESLDFGSDGWIQTESGKFVKPEEWGGEEDERD